MIARTRPFPNSAVTSLMLTASASVAVCGAEAAAHRVGSPCSAEPFLNPSSPLEPAFFLIGEDNVDLLPRLSSDFLGWLRDLWEREESFVFWFNRACDACSSVDFVASDRSAFSAGLAFPPRI